MIAFFVRSIWFEIVSVNRSIFDIILDFVFSVAVTCMDRFLCNVSEAAGELCYSLSSVVLLPGVVFGQDVSSDFLSADL